MFRCQVTNEVQPRWKNGQPHHSTTGVASRNSTSCRCLNEIICGTRPFHISPAIARMNTGTAKATPIQKRRVMSSSSGFSSFAATVLGSSAMPQIGQSPGSLRTISGCIGQTYSVMSGFGSAFSGSSAMPQTGQAPGLDSRTSGSIGQMYTAPGIATSGSAGLGCRYFSGSAENFAWHFGLQNRYVLPSCSWRNGESDFTIMSHTGSLITPSSVTLPNRYLSGFEENFATHFALQK